MLYTNAACWTTILLNALLLSHCIAVDSNLAYGDITGLAQRIDRLSAWFARPKQLPDVKPLLPDARPTQPWPYRKLDAATAYSVSLTSTHAILATVTHAPVPGVTGDMMLWWFREGVYGRSYYSGNEWDNYIRWHPQHHIYQRIKQPADGGSETPHSSPSAAAATTAAAKGSSSHPKPMLWEICEFMTSANPNGYTTGNFPGPEATAQEYFVKAVAEIRQLDHKGLWATVPTRTGLGPTIWNLKHEWADSPAGLAINSTQVQRTHASQTITCIWLACIALVMQTHLMTNFPAQVSQRSVMCELHVCTIMTCHHYGACYAFMYV